MTPGRRPRAPRWPGPCRRGPRPRPRGTPPRLARRLQRVRMRASGDPQRLVAGDRRHPGLRALRRLAAVPAAPGPYRGLLGRVLGRSGLTQNALRLAEALRTDEAPVPVGHLSPRECCNELTAQEGLPSMNITLASDSAGAYAVLAPAYDLLTAEYAYGPWLAAIEWLARPSRARGPAPAGRRLRHRQELHAAAGPRLRRHRLRHLAGDGGRGAREGRGPRGRAGGRHAAPADPRGVDLVTCIDDAINHLLDPDEVAATFEGMRANLAPGGCSSSTSTRSPPTTASPTSSSRTRSASCAGAAGSPSWTGRAVRRRSSSTSSPTRATGCGGGP